MLLFPENQKINHTLPESVSAELDNIFVQPPIELSREMGAYEALWASPNTTFKILAEIFLKKQRKDSVRLG